MKVASPQIGKYARVWEEAPRTDVSISTSGSTCFTLTMFEEPPNIGPVAYNFGCRLNWPDTVYRKLEVITSDLPSIASSQATPSLSFSTIVSPTSATATETLPSPSSSPPGSLSQSVNRAWVAGAAVGPIAGVAIVAGLLFLWRRRGKHWFEIDSNQVHELESPEQPAQEKFYRSRNPASAAHLGTRAELPASRT